MKKIALTGGIGSGKSTVAKMIRAKGIPVIDADCVVHELYRDPKIIGMLTALFGMSINEDGIINRKKLGAIVFQDMKQKQILDDFFRPRIQKRVDEIFTYYEQQKASAVVYDAALIYEWEIASQFDLVIVVDAPLTFRIMRICLRDHLQKEEAQARIDAQIPLSQKVAQADIVITNSEDFAYLQVQVEQVLLQITQ